MKRVLSLVLALVLVLGGVPVVFADDMMMTDGEKLQEAGFISGNAEGELNENDLLTREQMMVLIAQMKGVADEASEYPMASSFNDVKGDEWFAPYVAYAEVHKWVKGLPNGDFGVGMAVDSKMASTFMLAALGYELNSYETAVEEAMNVGIDVVESTELTRGEIFTAMWSTVNLTMADSNITLAEKLGKEIKIDEPASVLDAKFDEVNALGVKVVEIIFEDDVDKLGAENATYVITKRGESAQVPVEMVKLVESDRVFVYTTEALEGGKAYTMAMGDQTENFTAALKETDRPKVENVKGTDTERVEVEFDQVLDFVSATNIGNYSIDKIGTVTAAKLKEDNKTVELTVVGFEKSTSAKMTVQNVMNADGVVVNKTSRTFYATFDYKAPKIDKIIKPENNVEIILYWNDEHGVDKTMAEDVSNYEIDGLEIIKAKAKKKEYDSSNEINGKSSDYYNRVVLTTSAQKTNKRYTLKILNMVDGSVSKNPIRKPITEKFYGAREDKTAPKVSDMTAVALDKIAVTFDDKNDLDPVTALNAANYEVTKGDIDVIGAEFRDNDEEQKIIILTTTQMDSDDSTVKIAVNHVADVFGNAMDKAKTKTVRPKDVNHNGPTKIKSVTVKSLKKLVVKFEEPVTMKTAKDPTNYVVDEGIGGALKAEVADDKLDEVTLTFPEMKNNGEYTLTVSGVETYSGYAMNGSEQDFIATKTEQDFDKPEVESVDNVHRGILKVTFSEKVDVTIGAVTQVKIKGTWYNSTKLMGDNDDVVVFDISALEGTTDDDLDIQAFKGVKDMAGNELDYESGNETVSISKDDIVPKDDYVQLDDVYQENVRDIKFVFDDDVIIVAPKTLDMGPTGKEVTFTGKYIDDDILTELVFKMANGSKIDDGKKFVVDNYGTVIKDLIGRPVFVEKVSLTWDNDDDTKPTITDVKATNRRTVKVYYDEILQSAGTYRIEYDDDGDTKSVGIKKVEVDEDDENIVVITLKEDLEPDTYYTLYQGSKARDLSNNPAEKLDDGFQFVGNGTPKDETKLEGVKLFNGLNLQLVAGNEKFDAGTTYLVTTAGTTKSAISATATLLLPKKKLVNFNVAEYDALLKDQSYTIIGVKGTDVKNIVSFEGIVETWGAKLNNANTEIQIEDIDLGSGDDKKTAKLFVLDKDGMVVTSGRAITATDVKANEWIELKPAETTALAHKGARVTLVVYKSDDAAEVANGLVEYIANVKIK